MQHRYHQSFQIPLQYEVLFTRQLFDPANESLSRVVSGRPAKIIFFVDDGLLIRRPELPEQIEQWCRYHGSTITPIAPVQVVTGGEAIKNDLSILDRVGRLAMDYKLCRHSYVVIVGGGAVLDAVGFAAATVHRGLRQIRVPTTVVSQADSGVGVKNGLNRFGIKNFYGSFNPPVAVLNDAEFLKTLSDRDWVCGVAEAFKVAIIKDKLFFEELCSNAEAVHARDLDVMASIVRRCAVLHLDHIRNGGDPFETGSARPLDFGHWAAHRLESMTDNALRHGEAVAIGIALDLAIAERMGWIEPEDRERVYTAMVRCGMTLWHEALGRYTAAGELAVLEGIEQFREHLGGELTVTMPNGLGACHEIHELPLPVVKASVQALREREQARCTA